MKILCCMYGGEYGYNALRIASQIAKGTNSRLTVMYVAGRVGKHFAGSELKDQIFEKINDILKEKGVTAEKKFVTKKNIADVILEESDKGYNLVILGSARFSGLRRVLFRSVSHQVAEFADIPVLVVKRKTAEIKKILICTDGSKSAKSGCVIGTMIGKALGANVTMFSVAPEFSDEELAMNHNEEFANIVKKKVSADVEMIRRAGKYIPVYTPKPLERSVDVEMICRAGKGVKSVREEILKEAPKYDLVVCGSRGLSRMERVRIGHVSLAVKENADTNVLIVRGFKV